jgi:ABC-type branched-subunit amino acid transport system permease subunit
MKWVRFAAVVILACLITSFAEWAISGQWLTQYYMKDPDTWRVGNEQARILHSELIGLVSCIALTWLVGRNGRPSLGAALGIAVAAWFAGPFAQLATDHLWIRMDHHVVVGHAAEWLIRFLLVAVLGSVLLEKKAG